MTEKLAATSEATAAAANVRVTIRREERRIGCSDEFIQQRLDFVKLGFVDIWAIRRERSAT